MTALLSLVIKTILEIIGNFRTNFTLFNDRLKSNSDVDAAGLNNSALT